MLWKSLSAFGVQFDGASEVGETVLSTPGDGIEEREPVERVVGGGIAGKNPAELIASLIVVSGVQLRDGVVIVFAGSCEDQNWPFKLSPAGTDIHPATLFDGQRSIREQLFKCGQGLIELALLQQLNSSLVELQGRSCARARVTALVGIRGR